MTKKDFEVMADCLGEAYAKALKNKELASTTTIYDLQMRLELELKSTNARFDVGKFRARVVERKQLHMKF